MPQTINTKYFVLTKKPTKSSSKIQENNYMSLLKALMEGQDLTEKEATSRILEMKQRIYNDNEDPEEVLYEEGLEPDYVFELI